VAIVNDVEVVPVGETSSREPLKGLEQLTGAAIPSTSIVGWPGARLHSTTAPSDPGESPLAATVTVRPEESPVEGVTDAAGTGPGPVIARGALTTRSPAPSSTTMAQ
jgi:hypothetical protein